MYSEKAHRKEYLSMVTYATAILKQQLERMMRWTNQGKYLLLYLQFNIRMKHCRFQKCTRDVLFTYFPSCFSNIIQLFTYLSLQSFRCITTRLQRELALIV